MMMLLCLALVGVRLWRSCVARGRWMRCLSVLMLAEPVNFSVYGG